MNRFLKQVGLGVALAATTVAAAAPADAQRWRGGYRGYHHGGGGGGRLATGALLGGIVGLGVGAAIASNNRDRYYDRGYYYNAPPRVVYRDRYYAPPPPRVVVRERYYEPGYYGDGYGYGGAYYGGW